MTLLEAQAQRILNRAFEDYYNNCPDKPQAALRPVELVRHFVMWAGHQPLTRIKGEQEGK